MRISAILKCLLIIGLLCFAFYSVFVSEDIVLETRYVNKPLDNSPAEAMRSNPLAPIFNTTTRNPSPDDIYIPAAIQNKSIINPHNFKYILNPISACARDVEVVIGVEIGRNQAQARRALAETWGSYAYNKSNRAVLLFFIGNATKDEPLSIQRSIEEEFKKKQNIVQEDYMDVYRNLTLKTMSILKWVGKFCRNARYVIKVDGDIYLNIPLLLTTARETYSHLEKQAIVSVYKPDSKKMDPRHFILGILNKRIKPLRNKAKKWRSTIEEFPGDVYPNYLSGSCYSMPVITARYVFQIAIRTKIFWLEDVFITGISASVIGKVPQIRNWNQHVARINPATGCRFKTVASAHGISYEEMKTIYTELNDPNLKC